MAATSVRTPPLERLNYYNGQRLEAADFRLEQEYHVRVRRWLNRSLYTSGIAAGLEVTVKEGDAHRVVVSPGMALDSAGREIILLTAEELQVVGAPSPDEGVVFGNYLVIQYAEEKVAPLSDGCATPVKDKKGQKLSWGGPSRIRSEPLIHFQDAWPTESSGQIVLAQVELDETCAVRHIHTGVRKYAGAAQPSKALAYALEGEKDIDKDNSKQLRFHIRGGQPNAVTLYLRGDKFSSLYYTELGMHNHGIDFVSGSAGAVGAHSHTLSLAGISTDDGNSSHRHEIWSDTDDTQIGSLEVGGDASVFDQMLTGPGGIKGGRTMSEVKPGGSHHHSLTAGDVTTDSKGSGPAHSHSVSGATGNAGLNPLARTSGESLVYFKNLQVWLDGQDYTATILERLGWTELGNGTSEHVLVKEGTPEIQVERLGGTLSEGEHCLEFKVSSGGGRVQYNLYVE